MIIADYIAISVIHRAGPNACRAAACAKQAIGTACQRKQMSTKEGGNDAYRISFVRDCDAYVGGKPGGGRLTFDFSFSDTTGTVTGEIGGLVD